MQEVERMQMAEYLGWRWVYAQDVLAHTHLHENVHGHVHELRESTGLGVSDRWLPLWHRVSFDLSCFGALARGGGGVWVGIFLAQLG